MVSKTGSFAGSLSPEPAFTDYHPDSNFSSQSTYLIEQKDFSDDIIILEFPNGVKVTVNPSNLELISRLIKLA